MGARIQRVVSGWLLALMLSGSGGAGAVVITYQATDLLDTVAGEDRWQYRYSVSGSFGAFGGFNVRFSPALYRNLENPPPPAINADWLVSTIEPHPGLPADGLYGATRLAPGFALGDVFTLDFDWLGIGSPGSQPFEVFDESFFPPIETGQTQLLSTNPPPLDGQVPLPSTVALLGLGLLALRVCNRLTRRVSAIAGYAS